MYGFSQCEVEAFRYLAMLVLHSKQNVGTAMKDAADVVKRITGGVRTIKPSEKGLEPHEICLMCGSEGKPKRKRTPPVCHICTDPFTRQTPWRILRGKRVHVLCLKTSQ